MANDQGTFLAYRNFVEEVSNNGFTTDAVEMGSRVVTNLKTRESDDFWRFAVEDGETVGEVEIDFGSNVEIGAITTQFPRGTYPGVSESNPAFGPTDEIRYRLLDASDVVVWDSTSEASGVVPGYMMHFVEVDPPVTARKLIATYDAESRVASGFCDVGTLGAWSTFAPYIGFSYPAGYGWMLNNEKGRTPAGRLYSARFEPMRKWSLQFDGLTNAESMIVDEMIRYSGGARQVFVCRGDLPAGKNAMLAVVEAQRDIESRNATHRQQALTFEEFI